MLKELYRGMAIQMFNFSAAQAFFVEMVAAITALPHVLIEGTSVLFPMEFSQDVLLTKDGQLTVDAAFFATVLAVKGKTKLVGTKLSVGVLG